MNRCSYCPETTRQKRAGKTKAGSQWYRSVGGTGSSLDESLELLVDEAARDPSLRQTTTDDNDTLATDQENKFRATQHFQIPRILTCVSS
jgi:hypothetical protein